MFRQEKANLMSPVGRFQGRHPRLNAGGARENTQNTRLRTETHVSDEHLGQIYRPDWRN